MWFLYPSFGTSYSLFVKVNETVTGKEANDTTIFQLYTSKTKVVFSQSMPSTFKPGLKYTIMLRIEKSDGSSIESPLGTAKIIITYKYSVKVKESITTKTKLFFTKAVAVDKSGVVIQQVSFPKHAESGTVYPGRKLQLTVQVTEKIRSCYYKMFSKGTIVQQGIFAMNRLSRKQTIRVTHKMTPSFRILVYYVRRYGEIVADAVIFSVKDIFRNKVMICDDLRE
ncbi:CD109 [Mytilus edulis]|uniref:CD109 n=1 Tax=Mytilus edulis TaxID=6550 RepID=A0A8S3VBW9_MYTED|nr:CD109 [Mytilus edulis]